MADPFRLQRFVDAQRVIYGTALAELRSGTKKSHWMWFIFPQLAGLGRSTVAQFYALRSLDEARAYLDHPLLGPRLRECLKALLPWASTRTADQIVGPVDAMKLRSSLTLFDQIEPRGLFEEGLRVFFSAEPDTRTLALLNAAR